MKHRQRSRAFTVVLFKANAGVSLFRILRMIGLVLPSLLCVLIADADERDHPTPIELSSAYIHSGMKLSSVNVKLLHSQQLSPEYLTSIGAVVSPLNGSLALPIELVKRGDLVHLRFPGTKKITQVPGGGGVPLPEAEKWQFPAAAPTGDSLTSDFLDFTVVSGSLRRGTPTTIWYGLGSAEESHAVITDDSVAAVSAFAHFPPFCTVDPADIGNATHPIDIFCLQDLPLAKTRGLEDINGEQLLAIEGQRMSTIPTEQVPAGRRLEECQSFVAFLSPEMNYCPVRIERYSQDYLDGKPVAGTRSVTAVIEVTKFLSLSGVAVPATTKLTGYGSDRRHAKKFDFEEYSSRAGAPAAEYNQDPYLRRIAVLTEEWDILAADVADVGPSDELTITFPVGALVFDKRTNQMSGVGLDDVALKKRLGQPVSEVAAHDDVMPREANWRIYFLMINVGVMLLIAAVYLWRRAGGK